MNGQTTMVAVVIAVVMLMFLAVFMLTSFISSYGGGTTDSEYRDLFATNTLLSLLGTQTDCGSFADMLEASYFGSGRCDDDEFEKRLPDYMKYVLNETGHTDYRWMLEISPSGVSSSARVYPEGGEDITAKLGYWDSNTMLSRGGNHIEVKLYMRND
jgi:hypothetical protein